MFFSVEDGKKAVGFMSQGLYGKKVMGTFVSTLERKTCCDTNFCLSTAKCVSNLSCPLEGIFHSCQLISVWFPFFFLHPTFTGYKKHLLLFNFEDKHFKFSLYLSCNCQNNHPKMKES